MTSGLKKCLSLSTLLTLGLIIWSDQLSLGREPLSASAEAVTFSDQIVRLFQNNCQVCHHPGGIGPFSLMTYEQAHPYAERIRQVTRSGYMPPWRAVEGCGQFEGERSLTPEEIELIARWVDAGAPEGDSSNLPPAREFAVGWKLGEPDVVVTTREPYRPDPIEEDVYRCFTTPTNLTEDRYVRGVEVVPGNPAIVHHVLLFVDTTGESVGLDAAEPGAGYTCFGGPGLSYDENNPPIILGGWVPGGLPQLLPEGAGLLLPAGSRLVMQVHYHPTGGPELDQTSIGLYLANEPVQKQMGILPLLLNDEFTIPAGAERYEVTASRRLPRFLDFTLYTITPHMHLLGREMHVTATLPDGSSQCLVSIDDWDFEWQETYLYKQPVRLPGGTQLDLTAYYHNSERNLNNPNSPPQDVSWGEGTNDEMCIVFFAFTVDF